MKDSGDGNETTPSTVSTVRTDRWFEANTEVFDGTTVDPVKTYMDYVANVIGDYDRVNYLVQYPLAPRFHFDKTTSP